MDLSFLPAVNAGLNAVAASLLVLGRVWIARGRVDAHRRTMLTAFGVSSLFLLLYVAHKAWRGFENTPYHGEGAAQIAYLCVLITHLSLAMAVPVLAITLIALGLRGRIERHRRLARIAWPIWLYVSATGVVIYLLLYPLNPRPEPELGGAPATQPRAPQHHVAWSGREESATLPGVRVRESPLRGTEDC